MGAEFERTEFSKIFLWKVPVGAPVAGEVDAPSVRKEMRKNGPFAFGERPNDTAFSMGRIR